MHNIKIRYIFVCIKSQQDIYGQNKRKNMKYLLSQKILDRILSDNEFSLELSQRLKRRQESIIRAAKRQSNILRLPEQIAFYKEKGYTDDDIFDIANEKSAE